MACSAAGAGLRRHRGRPPAPLREERGDLRHAERVALVGVGRAGGENKALHGARGVNQRAAAVARDDVRGKHLDVAADHPRVVDVVSLRRFGTAHLGGGDLFGLPAGVADGRPGDPAGGVRGGDGQCGLVETGHVEDGHVDLGVEEHHGGRVGGAVGGVDLDPH